LSSFTPNFGWNGRARTAAIIFGCASAPFTKTFGDTGRWLAGPETPGHFGRVAALVSASRGVQFELEIGTLWAQSMLHLSPVAVPVEPFVMSAQALRS